MPLGLAVKGYVGEPEGTFGSPLAGFKFLRAGATATGNSPWSRPCQWHLSLSGIHWQVRLDSDQRHCARRHSGWKVSAAVCHAATRMRHASFKPESNWGNLSS